MRRSPEQARESILLAAEALLIECGPAAVSVRAVAARVDMTDAGVAHHFGTREDLWVALLRHGGRKIRTAVREAVETWTRGEADVESLIAAMAGVYDQGYAELAVGLHAAGWREQGSGFLEPVVETLHAARSRGGVRPRLADTRLAVAALHQALALEPVYGAAFRRSAGIRGSTSDNPGPQLRWWAAAVGRALDLEDD